MATGSARQTTTKLCVSALQKYSSGNLFGITLKLSFHVDIIDASE